MNERVVVFLCAEVMGYTIATAKSLVSKFDVRVTIIGWDKKKLTPFKEPKYEGIKHLKKSGLTGSDIVKVLVDANPPAIYLAGWMDKEYIESVRTYRKINHNVKVVCGMDNQWRGDFRQYLGILKFRLYYKSIIDYMWVPGRLQYDFAVRLGVNRKRIIMDLLSADLAVFSSKAKVARRFVYVGRLHPNKGLDLFLSAYKELPRLIKASWPVVLIGNGPQLKELKALEIENVTFIPFLQPADLKRELDAGGVFVLPSKKEPWGVVVHELAAMGYPLIISSACGAKETFLINNYNGFVFQTNNQEDLKNRLIEVATLSFDKLMLFSERSQELSKRITPESSAANFYSVF